MLASLLGITMAFVLQQGDVQRQHLEFSLNAVYVTDTGYMVVPRFDWVA